MQEPELLHAAYECRKFFRRVYTVRKRNQQRVTVCRTISDTDEIVWRWYDYFEECWGEEISEIENTIQYSAETRLEHDEEQLPPANEEVEKAVKRLNNSRNAGPDNIPGELFEKGGKELLNRMHAVTTNVWEAEKIPKDCE